MLDTFVNPFVNVIELIDYCIAILVHGEMAGAHGVVKAEYSLLICFPYS